MKQNKKNSYTNKIIFAVYFFSLLFFSVPLLAGNVHASCTLNWTDYYVKGDGWWDIFCGPGNIYPSCQAPAAGHAKITKNCTDVAGDVSFYQGDTCSCDDGGGGGNPLRSNFAIDVIDQNGNFYTEPACQGGLGGAEMSIEGSEAIIGPKCYDFHPSIAFGHFGAAAGIFTTDVRLTAKPPPGYMCTSWEVVQGINNTSPGTPISGGSGSCQTGLFGVSDYDHTVAVHFKIAPIPTPTLSLSCNSSDQVVVNWSNVGTPFYHIRLDTDPSSWNGDCSNPNNRDICNNQYYDTNYTIGSTENRNYHFWVHGATDTTFGSAGTIEFNYQDVYEQQCIEYTSFDAIIVGGDLRHGQIPPSSSCSTAQNSGIGDIQFYAPYSSQEWLCGGDGKVYARLTTESNRNISAQTQPPNGYVCDGWEMLDASNGYNQIAFGGPGDCGPENYTMQHGVNRLLVLKVRQKAEINTILTDNTYRYGFIPPGAACNTNLNVQGGSIFYSGTGNPMGQWMCGGDGLLFSKITTDVNENISIQATPPPNFSCNGWRYTDNNGTQSGPGCGPSTLSPAANLNSTLVLDVQPNPSNTGICGDGTIQSPNSNGVYEDCDDGNTTDWDSCHSDCTLETYAIGSVVDDVGKYYGPSSLSCANVSNPNYGGEATFTTSMDSVQWSCKADGKIFVDMYSHPYTDAESITVQNVPPGIQCSTDVDWFVLGDTTNYSGTTCSATNLTGNKQFDLQFNIATDPTAPQQCNQSCSIDDDCATGLSCVGGMCTGNSCPTFTNPPTPTPTPPTGPVIDGWWQVRGGLLLSNDNFTNPIASSVLRFLIIATDPSNELTAGIPIAPNGFDIDVNNEPTQREKPYQAATTGANPHAEISKAKNALLKKAEELVGSNAHSTPMSEKPSCTPIPGTTSGASEGGETEGAAATETSICYVDGDLTISNPTTWSIDADENLIIVAKGDIVFSGTAPLNTITPGGFLGFIAGGTITFEEDMGNTTSQQPNTLTPTPTVHAVFLADSITIDGEPTGNGQFVGKGVFAATNDIVSKRKLSADGDTYPSSYFVHNPLLVQNAPDFFKSTRLEWGK